jgi:hypothetical protein
MLGVADLGNSLVALLVNTALGLRVQLDILVVFLLSLSEF